MDNYFNSKKFVHDVALNLNLSHEDSEDFESDLNNLRGDEWVDTMLNCTNANLIEEYRKNVNLDEENDNRLHAKIVSLRMEDSHSCYDESDPVLSEGEILIIVEGGLIQDVYQREDGNLIELSDYTLCDLDVQEDDNVEFNNNILSSLGLVKYLR